MSATSTTATNPVLLSAMRKLKSELNSDIAEFMQSIRDAQEEKPLNKWVLMSIVLGKNDQLTQEEWYAVFEEAGVPTEPYYATPLESLKDKFDLIQKPGAFDHAVSSYPRGKVVPRYLFCEIVESTSPFWLSDAEMLAFADACGVPQFLPAEVLIYASMTSYPYAPQGAAAQH